MSRQRHCQCLGSHAENRRKGPLIPRLTSENEAGHQKQPINGTQLCDCGRNLPLMDGRSCSVCLGEQINARRRA